MRSGTGIIVSDAEGSVFIENPGGNTWMMDGQGNMRVNAPNDITMNTGGHISMTVEQTISSTVLLHLGTLIQHPYAPYKTGVSLDK
jgi:type VI secretion system secreted protein VgrG